MTAAALIFTLLCQHHPVAPPMQCRARVAGYSVCGAPTPVPVDDDGHHRKHHHAAPHQRHDR